MYYKKNITYKKNNYKFYIKIIYNHLKKIYKIKNIYNITTLKIFTSSFFPEPSPSV